MGDQRNPNNGVEEEKDRISTLPDELIHHIFSFLDPKVAVESCVLSKRWVNIWKTLPYLNFDPSRKYNTIHQYYYYEWDEFIPKFLENRDKKAVISTVVADLRCLDDKLIFMNNAISHNVKHLEITFPTKENFNLSFPSLETLHITNHDSSFMHWSLPSLTTLYLNNIFIRPHAIWSFEGFSNLKILTLDTFNYKGSIPIKSPNLTTLTICQWGFEDRHYPNPVFMILAPKLSSFSYYGNRLSPISSEGGGYPCLKDVVFGFDFEKHVGGLHINLPRIMEVMSILREFRGAMCLTLSFKTIQVLSSFLESPEFWPSPFRNLKTLRLVDPVSDRAINLMDSVNHVINYLLNSSPDMKIFVKDCGGKIRSYNPKMDVLQKKDCGYCKVKSQRNDSLNGQSASNVEVNGDEPESVPEVIPPVLFPRAVNGVACSFNEKSSLSIWDVSQIHSEYVDLLKCIKEEHPETFEHFAPQTEFIHTWGLNALCSLVKAFYEDYKAGFTLSLLLATRACSLTWRDGGSTLRGW